MSVFDRIVVPLWMLVPPAERLVLAEALHLPHSGVTEIRDQEVVTDGYTNEDLGSITFERMAEYVGSEDTFSRLWELTVAKAHSTVNPPMGVLESEAGVMSVGDVPAPEGTARPTKHAKGTKAH